MVVVVKRGRREEVERIFRRWDLEVVPIGEVTDTGRALLTAGGEVVADMPTLPLTEEAPVYTRPVEVPDDLAARQSDPEVPVAEDAGGVLNRLLQTPQLASKEWISTTTRCAPIR